MVTLRVTELFFRLNWCLIKDCRLCFRFVSFFSVAFLIFKCLAWHVCIEFLFGKISYYKIVWCWVFLFYLESFIPFCNFFLKIHKNIFNRFSKRVSIEQLPTLLYVCILHWSLFAFFFCLHRSKKWKYLTDFLICFSFSQNSAKSEILVSMNRMDLKRSLPYAE